MTGAIAGPQIGSTRLLAHWRHPAALAYLLLTGTALAYLVFALVSSGSATVWTSGLVWLCWLVLGYWLVSLACRGAMVPTGVRVAAVLWGAVCLMYSGRATAGLERVLPVMAAPVSEEIFKLLGVVLMALVMPAIFRRPMGALFCGMLAGLGFTFIENWFMTNAFVAQGEESLVAAVLTRGLFFGPWGHLLFTGIAALSIWYVVSHPGTSWWRRMLPAAGFVLLAIGLHAFHNASGEIGGFLLKIVVWVVYLVALVLLIRWARRSS
jgi:RsiW-degrading membrane proteinase PrsW (M82 family)